MNEDLTTLKLEHDEHLPEGVLSVVLNRPEVHDAFDDVMIVELTRVFTALADDDSVRVVLLRSNGKHFSAGADLNWMKRVADQEEEANRADARQLEAMFRAIASCPKPVVARVQGGQDQFPVLVGFQDSQIGDDGLRTGTAQPGSITLCFSIQESC